MKRFTGLASISQAPVSFWRYTGILSGFLGTSCTIIKNMNPLIICTTNISFLAAALDMNLPKATEMIEARRTVSISRARSARIPTIGLESALRWYERAIPRKTESVNP